EDQSDEDEVRPAFCHVLGRRLAGRFFRSGLVLGLLPGLELFVFLLVLRPDDARNRTPRDAHARARGDLDEELVVGDAPDVPEEAAGSDDLVSHLDVLDQRALLRLATALRPEDE